MADGPAGDAQRPLNVNRYATKKTIAQGMLDIALLTANASQLKYVLQTGGKHPFYTLMISLISVSIILQITVGISILYIGTLNINKEKHCTRANLLNNLITVQIFIISAVNVIISAFGIEQVNIYQAESARRLAAEPARTPQSLLQGNQTVMIFDEDRLRSV